MDEDGYVSCMHPEFGDVREDLKIPDTIGKDKCKEMMVQGESKEEPVLVGNISCLPPAGFNGSRI